MHRGVVWPAGAGWLKRLCFFFVFGWSLVRISVVALTYLTDADVRRTRQAN
jgi:hypothetical protein